MMTRRRTVVALIATTVLAAGLAVTGSPPAVASPRTDSPLIALDPSMATLESGYGTPGRLVDEQDTIVLGPNGVPVDTGVSPTTSWATDTRWSISPQSEVPRRGYLDLGAEYVIDTVSVWKQGATTELEFLVGVPGRWDPLVSFDGTGYRWVSKSVEPVTTRYVAIELTGDGSSVVKAPEIALFGTPTGRPGTEAVRPTLIPLSPDQIFPVTGLVAPGRFEADGTASSTAQWVDEQEGLGWPIRTTPTTSFSRIGQEVAGQVSMNEVVADLDFRGDYRIEYIAVYVERENKPGTTLPAGDATAARLSFATGGYDDWSQILAFTTTGSGWTIIPVAEVSDADPDRFTSRYLRVTKDGKRAPLAEIAVFGTPVGEPVPVDDGSPARRAPTDMGAFFGTNSFVYTDVPDLLGPGSTARIYANPSLNGVGANPTGTDVVVDFRKNDQDRFYEDHHAAGVEAFPVFANGIGWLTGGDPERKPIPDRLTAGRSSAELADVYRDPASYGEHASMMFQYAARYGSVPVDRSLLRLEKNTPARSGLGVVRYFENWNEQDAHWTKGSAPLWSTSFTAEEFAAMTSADYDGHEGTLGPDRGIKNADPDARLVLGGLAGAYSEYIRAMDYWFRHHRTDGRFAADVINLHHYAGAQAPERDSTYAQFREVVEYSESQLGDLPVWVSEFGWDVGRDAAGACSDRCAPDEPTQGAWVLREYLLGAAAGVDSMQQYMLADTTNLVTNPNAQRYASSGLMAKDGDDVRTKRPAWYYQLTARGLLDGTTFAEAVSGSTFGAATGDGDVHVLRFTDGADRDVYAVWTVDGTVPGYAVPVPGATSAVVTALDHLKPSGTSVQATVTGGAVRVDASPTPVFVSVSRGEATLTAPESVVQATSYQGAHDVELTGPEGAEIHYTTDYSVPTADSPRYEGPITVATTGTVRAVAVRDGVSSPVAAIPVIVWDLPGGLSSVALDGTVLTPSLERAETYYEALVDADATTAALTVTTPGPQVSVTVNGTPVEADRPITVDLVPGLTTLHVEATHRHTGATTYSTVRVARPTELGLQVISPVSAGIASGAGHTPFAKLWQHPPTLNEYYLPVTGEHGRETGGGGTSVGYVDFGENWRNLRLTGTWTQYRGWANGQQTPYAELWWDDDTDAVNDTGATEDRFTFSSAARVGTPNDDNPLWVQDSDLGVAPVTPGGRYLMFREQKGTAERAIELAFTGYVVDHEQPGPDLTPVLLRPVGAGGVGTAWTPMDRLFDGDTVYDPVTGPSLTDAGDVPYVVAGRTAYIDLGPDWERLRITQVWGHYRAWSTVTGDSPVDVFWDATRTDASGATRIVDDRLSLHATAVPFSAQPQWSLDDDFTGDPLVPRGRYIIVVPRPGGDWRMDELALVGYRL